MNPALSFVIIYDDPSAGHRAHTAMELLADGFDGEAAPRHSVWRMDLLDYPEWREQTLADAAAADFIILSTSRSDALPPTIHLWLEQYREVQHEEPAVIFALLGSDNAWKITIEDDTGAHVTQLPQRLLPAPPELAELTCR